MPCSRRRLWRDSSAIFQGICSPGCFSGRSLFQASTDLFLILSGMFVQMDFFLRVKSCCWIPVCAALSAGCVCVSDIAIDWSDYGLWWPDKNIWLARTRSTLDQYGVQADAKLLFTPMHKNLRIMLPDLQVLDMPVNFSTNVFTNVVRICRELGKFACWMEHMLIE